MLIPLFAAVLIHAAMFAQTAVLPDSSGYPICREAVGVYSSWHAPDDRTALALGLNLDGVPAEYRAAVEAGIAGVTASTPIQWHAAAHGADRTVTVRVSQQTPCGAEALACAYPPPDGRYWFEPQAGDVFLKSNVNWCEVPSISPDNVGGSDRCYSMRVVVLHEMGHVLGLQHTSRQDSVMYPYVIRDFRVFDWFTQQALRQMYLYRPIPAR